MRTLTLRQRALTFTAAALLAGCGGSQPLIGTPAATPQNHATAEMRDRELAPTYKSSGPLLFIVNFDSPPYDAVTIYNARASNPNPLAAINKGVNDPNGDCVDADGTLYVGSDLNSGWISEYAPGKTKPFKTITDGIDGPALCTIDGQGNLWVTNNGGAPNVTEYLNGSTKPHMRITKGLTYPIGIAIDSDGNLYVGNHVLYGTTNVQVYPLGGKSPTRTITDGVVWPTGIAVDAQGTLYVANDSPPCNVEEYRFGQSHPYRTITDEIDGPGGLVVGKNGWLYVSDEGLQGCSGARPAVLEFRPGAMKPSRREITAGLHTPVGDAFYPPLLP